MLSIVVAYSGVRHFAYLAVLLSASIYIVEKRVLWYQLRDRKTLLAFRLNASVFIRVKVRVRVRV